MSIVVYRYYEINFGKLRGLVCVVREGYRDRVGCVTSGFELSGGILKLKKIF